MDEIAVALRIVTQFAKLALGHYSKEVKPRPP
jgi:hypothetical protein